MLWKDGKEMNNVEKMWYRYVVVILDIFNGIVKGKEKIWYSR